jgi:hypothetical protein
VSEYAAPQALMRMTVAISVIQNSIKLSEVETFFIPGLSNLSIEVLAALEW